MMNSFNRLVGGVRMRQVRDESAFDCDADFGLPLKSGFGTAQASAGGGSCFSGFQHGNLARAGYFMRGPIRNSEAASQVPLGQPMTEKLPDVRYANDGEWSASLLGEFGDYGGEGYDIVLPQDRARATATLKELERLGYVDTQARGPRVGQTEGEGERGR